VPGTEPSHALLLAWATLLAAAAPLLHHAPPFLSRLTSHHWISFCRVKPLFESLVHSASFERRRPAHAAHEPACRSAPTRVARPRPSRLPDGPSVGGGPRHAQRVGDDRGRWRAAARPRRRPPRGGGARPPSLNRGGRGGPRARRPRGCRATSAPRRALAPRTAGGSPRSRRAPTRARRWAATPVAPPCADAPGPSDARERCSERP